MAPYQRRESMLRLLGEELRQRDLVHAVDLTREHATVAVWAHDRGQLARLLRELGEVYPALQVQAGTQPRPFSESAASELDPKDVKRAHWLAIGVPLEIRAYEVGTDGFLQVLPVQWVEGSQRVLALYNRALRSDWTGQLGSRPGGLTQGGSPAVVANQVHDVGTPEARTDLVGDVDVVYTWVDSSDPAWQRAREEHTVSGVDDLPSAANDERYLDRDELRYSLRSLELFAPFVRHVYLVTADQAPEWLDRQHERLTVVSHREIFPDPEMLPTFNSHAIEACLHRIPGLSENYLYLNDDVLFGREVSRQDFFTLGGLMKVRFGFGTIYDGEPHTQAIPTDWAAYNANSLMERDFGISFRRKLKHVQHPQKRSLLQEIEDRYPEHVAATRWARFRSNSDVAIPSMLAGFHAIATARGVEWPHVPFEYVYADTGRREWEDRCARIVSNRPKFICLNATRHRQVGLEQQAHNLRTFLEDILPVPSSFERSGAG